MCSNEYKSCNIAVPHNIFFSTWFSNVFVLLGVVDKRVLLDAKLYFSCNFSCNSQVIENKVRVNHVNKSLFLNLS